MSFKPEMFGKFILLDKIASGGMAEVYLAKTLGAENVAKFVAVKKILPQFSKNQEFINMFKEEAKITVNLSHSNIVSIFEFGEENQNFYLAMEYVEGRNLRQIINRLKEVGRSFSQEQALYIINEAARGLDHAHRCIDGNTGRPLNIIHRDVSPQNIMINFEGNVKLVDFGIAKAESQVDTTRTGTLKGKFSYMSPEQAEGQEIDSRTDVFSLGIILWELLATERLFLASNEVNTLKKIKDCHIPSLHKLDPKISVDLERIVSKALARDRNLRYQSASDLHRDLNSFLNRNNPDFSPHDFSITIKQLFAEELLESRRKLIEYAKVRFNNKNDEKTVYVEMNTSTLTEPSSTNPTTKVTAKTKSDSNRKIDNESLPFLANEKDQKETLAKLKPLADSPALALESKPDKINVTTSNKRRTPKLKIEDSIENLPEHNYDSPKNSSFANIILVIVALGCAYYVLESNTEIANLVKCKALGQSYCQQIPHTQKKPELILGSRTMESISFSVMIMTQPPGAEIIVNGSSRGFTPTEVQVPTNAPITLTVKKEGFQTETSVLTPKKSGETFNVKMKKIKIGYLSVRVLPGNAVIYINDQKLPLSPPIERYVVPAYTELKVRAYDPLTGATDEQTMSVKENTQQSITLFLKKTNRQTASPESK